MDSAVQTQDKPVDVVLRAFKLPLTPRDFQIREVNNIAPLPRSGLYWEPGVGKTLGSTLCALYKMVRQGVMTTIVLMPPILITNWTRFLKTITDCDGNPLKVLAYRGTPAERKEMSLVGNDFICMSLVVFKRDFKRISKECSNFKVHVTVDEATSLKNVGSDNHKLVDEFCEDKSLQLLTGTPLNSPGDAYAYIKLVAPGTYRSLYQFENLHVGKRDFFDKPKEWVNVELIRGRMQINTSRVLKEDVFKDLATPILTPIYYDLDPKHLRLYRKLAEEKLLEYQDGTKLDATGASKLTHALHQIICNWGHFAQDEKCEAAIYELIKETLDELGQSKLVVFTHYQLTSAAIHEKFKDSHGAVAVWGKVPPAAKDAALDRFIADKSCRMLVLQQVGGGFGIDGLQAVCSDCLYVECPTAPIIYNQSTSRLYRNGQLGTVNVRIAMASGTLQVRALKALALNQTLVDSIQMSYSDLRAAIFGE